MYNANNVEQKVIELYQSGQWTKAIQYTALIGYDKPILVDKKLQCEWLTTDKLRGEIGLSEGITYNDGLWLFIIHGGELKVLTLLPTVHSVSYLDLIALGIAPLIDEDEHYVKNCSITVGDSTYKVDVGDETEIFDLYAYITKPRIAVFIDDSDSFEYDLIYEYVNSGFDYSIRTYDKIWSKGHNAGDHVAIVMIEPQEFLFDWKIEKSAFRQHESASGNKMAWLPVLRWDGYL